LVIYPKLIFKEFSTLQFFINLLFSFLGMHGQVASRFKDQQALSTHFFAGAAAGAAQAFISSPMVGHFSSFT
jgi:hypothetical protein